MGSSLKRAGFNKLSSTNFLISDFFSLIKTGFTKNKALISSGFKKSFAI